MNLAMPATVRQPPLELVWLQAARPEMEGLMKRMKQEQMVRVSERSAASLLITRIAEGAEAAD